MKKIFVIMFAGAAALFMAGCTPNSYTVKGTFEGLEGSVYLLDEDGTPVDSAAVVDGSFTIKKDYEGPAYYTLRDNLGGRPTFVTRFFVEKGTMTVQEDTLHRGKYVVGTPSNDAFLAMNDEIKEFMKSSREQKLSEDETEDAYNDIVASYLEKNHKNYFGAYLLSQQSYYYSGQDLLDEVNAFPESLQSGRILVNLRETAEQKVKVDAGQPYIEIIQNDPEGNPVALSSVIENPDNKYVLVDFWASWCGPCMGEVPYLVQTYQEFHSQGFEIYGVSFDTKAENWTKTIAEKEMSWVHVSDLNRFQCQAAEDYAVQAIPTNYLIKTEDGTIVARNLRGEDVYNTISSLLTETAEDAE